MPESLDKGNDPADFVIENGRLTKYTGPDGDVTVPDGVTEIRWGVFADRKLLRSVTLPEGLREIGIWAFKDCNGLREVTLPDSLTKIGDSAFKNCGLKSLKLPAGFRELGTCAFENCRGLVEIAIPDGVTEIRNESFDGCESLRSVTLPDGVQRIGGWAFRSCTELRGLRLPAGLRTVGDGAFAYCENLTELRFPDGVRTIGSGAVRYCTGLKLVTLPESLEEIGSDCFRECSCEIRIPRWIPSLTQALDGCGDVRIRTGGPLTEIPEQFRTAALLGYAAENESDIGSERARSYERYARRMARELVGKAFERPELMHLLCSRDLIPPGTMGDYLAEAEKRGSVEQRAMLLGSVGRIGPERIALAGERRRELEEANGEKRAARLARSMTPEDIAGLHFILRGDAPKEESVPELREWLRRHGAFADEKLSPRTDYLVILSSPDPDDWIGPERELIGRGGVAEIDAYRFLMMIGRRFAGKDRKDESFRIPGWLREIRDGLFRDFEQESLTVPAGVRRIGAEAFRGCEKLRELILPEGLTEIGAGAFHGCRQLTELTLPESLTALGPEAVRDCPALTALKIPAGIAEIGELTFKGCTGLRELTLREGLTAIGRRAFNGCRSLTALTLPESVRTIGQRAFADCRALGELRIPAGARWTEDPFGGCRALTLRAPAGSFTESWAREQYMRFKAL